MILVREISIPAGSTAGMLATLGVLPQGEFEIQIYTRNWTPVQVFISEDAAGTNPKFQPSISPNEPTRVTVRNEDLFVTNTSGSTAHPVWVLVVQK